jgi:hypothetical protein
LGGRFLHLTQGFEVTSASGDPVCTVVDDVTISADLDPHAGAPEGWIRVLTDDVRLLQLLARQCDPASSVDKVLSGVAGLWGGSLEQIGNVWRLDVAGGTVALAMPAGAERERPGEIVTPPLTDHHAGSLEELLAPAHDLGFVVPREAAVHIHYDGAPFRTPVALANLVRLFGLWREPLRRVFGTNPSCRRLAALPQQLLDAASGPPSVDRLRAAAAEGGLTKFYDINLTQVLRDDPVRDTVEIRILPGSIDAGDIIARAALLERLLGRCLDPVPFPSPPGNLPSAVAALRRLASG